MASNKFTWLELRKAVAEYAHCSEQEAEIFLSALLESVVNGLKKDKQVKIKGLGVFALKPVAPRKSVNIATGQDFTIEGYNKLTFTAESMLKESVEKRIEKPATEEVINAISICAATDKMVELTLSKLKDLRGCQAHSSHLLSSADENVLRRLGIQLTSEARFPTNDLFHM